MSNEFKKPRDSFTFSLGGLSTVAMVAFSPAISDDRINRIRDERLKHGKGEKPGETATLAAPASPARLSSCRSGDAMAGSIRVHCIAPRTRCRAIDL